MSGRTIVNFGMGRYTDFLVNEIDEQGNVVHLTNLEYKGRGKKNARVADGGSKDKKGTESGSTSKAEPEEAPVPTPVVEEFKVLKVFTISPNISVLT